MELEVKWWWAGGGAGPCGGGAVESRLGWCGVGQALQVAVLSAHHLTPTTTAFCPNPSAARPAWPRCHVASRQHR